MNIEQLKNEAYCVGLRRAISDKQFEARKYIEECTYENFADFDSKILGQKAQQCLDDIYALRSELFSVLNQMEKEAQSE